MNNNRYDTLAEASVELKQRGFNANLKVNENQKMVDSDGNQFDASQVTLVEFHRFEGMSNPADSSIIYAVEVRESNNKGMIIQSFGAETKYDQAEFIKKIAIKNES